MRRATAQPPRPLRFQPPIACSAVTHAVFVGAPLQIHPRVEVTALTAASLELIPALLGPALRYYAAWASHTRGARSYLIEGLATVSQTRHVSARRIIRP